MNILNKLSRLFLLLILFSFFTTTYAQLTIDKGLSQRKLKARGQHAWKVGDLYSALFYFEEAVKRDTNDIDAIFKMGELHELTRNYSKAEEAYETVYKKANAKYPYSLYEMAIMQKMTGRYEEAKANLNLFRKETRNLGDKAFKIQLVRDIAGCDSGITYRDFPDNVKFENIGSSVNQPHVEFSPVATDTNNMLYGSLRIEKMKYYENEEHAPRRQIYKATKTDNNWSETGLDETFNDPLMDMGNFVYAPISDRYYFTKCGKNTESKVLCKIYYTERVKGVWQAAIELPEPINYEGFTSTHPAIMHDSISAKSSPIEYLYYVSDRPDGKGGLDIWTTYYNKAKKEWTKPVNVAMTNTHGNEITPYFHVPTQSFYFSSDGYATAGGLDIFKIKKNKTRFSTPQNVSFPINSPQDDFDFKLLNKEGTKGFCVSNRYGSTPYSHETCCDDIFRFEIFPQTVFNCKLDITITETDTSIKSQVLTIKSVDQKTKKVQLDSVKVTSGKFTYKLEPNHNYTFKVNRDDYENDSLTVATREMSSTPVIQKTITMKPVEKVEKYELITEIPTEGKAFVLNDIQYETNSSELSKEAIATIDSLLIPFLKLHPKDKLHISSYTDDLGSHKSNLKLSQLRADNVVKYLLSKGINQHRLHGTGHGESKPIAPNENPDGSPNEVGRSINRRTEFLLVK